jgi:uncharacterized repeat protein (TIGR03803 family)
MTPSGTVTIVHAFTSPPDAVFPLAPVIQASDGNFYGTTVVGGPGSCTIFGCGTVFKMTPGGNVTILHAFTGTDGSLPAGDGAFFPAITSGTALIQATDGNLYGTTAGGGLDAGVVFRLTLPPAITTQPASQTIASGQTASLSVVAAGSGLSYQWYVGPTGTTTTPIAGATSSSYTTAPLTSTTSYWVRVSNVSGTADSNTATIAVNGSPNPTIVLDAPANGTTTGPSFSVSGWAIDRGAGSGTGVDAVYVWAYPNPGSGTAPVFLGVATYGIARPDIGALFGSQFGSSGFQFSVSALAAGRYQITAFEHSAVTNTIAASASTIVTVGSTPVSSPAMVLDSPRVNSTVGLMVTFAGWAIDRGAASGTGTDQVIVWAYPGGGGAPQYVGATTYGIARPDIGAAFGAQFTNSGFQLTVAISPGTYTFVAFAHSTVANAYSAVAAPNVTVTATHPYLFIDAPGPNTTATRPFTLSGWAVDTAAPTGTGIDAIAVWAYPTGGGTPLFVGNAAYGSSRPDIGALFGDARFTPSGYSFTVTASTLAAGAYNLVVFGHSTVTNSFTAVGVNNSVTVQ